MEQHEPMNTSSLDKEAWLKSRKYILEALEQGIDSHSEKDVFYANLPGFYLSSKGEMQAKDAGIKIKEQEIIK